MAVKTVNLIVPGLFHAFTPSETEHHPVSDRYLIQKLVSKANMVNSSSFAFPPGYLQHLPVAHYDFLASTGKSKKLDFLIYADPVYFELKSDHILARPVLIDTHNLTKLRHIINILNEYFEDREIFFEVLESGRVVCHFNQHSNVSFTSLYNVLGRDIKHFLPVGPDERFWKSIFNEIQMVLHEKLDDDEKIINQQMINGFWLWGTQSEYTLSSSDIVIAGKPSWLSGLCLQHGLQHQQIEDISALTAEECYLIDEDLLTSSSSGDFSSWLIALAEFESSVLSPLYHLLLSGKIDQLVIPMTAESMLKIKRSHHFRFYRKLVTIKTLCNEQT